ncbi:hypothetical protein LXL04_025192 [Taraxacum kok-saghyz]
MLIYVEPQDCLSKRALVERGDIPIYIATYRPTHIFPRTRELPQFPISPKPLFLSKNRLRNPPKPVLKQNKKLCTYAHKKSLHICKVFGKKKSFFRKFFFATGLIFERYLAPRSRFFEKVNGLGVLGWDLLRTHIFPRTRELPQFPISPKPLFLSKNRLRNPPKLFGKKKVVFSEFFFATGLIFERFLAPRSRFFEKGTLPNEIRNSSTLLASPDFTRHPPKALRKPTPFPSLLENVDDGEERSGNQIAGDNVLPEQFFTTAYASVGRYSQLHRRHNHRTGIPGRHRTCGARTSEPTSRGEDRVCCSCSSTLSRVSTTCCLASAPTMADRAVPRLV